MKVVGLGDSLTYGYAVPKGEGWFDRMAVYFPQTIWVNRGIPGDDTKGMLERFVRDVVQEKADMVTILGGVNDLMNQMPADSVVRRLTQMGELAEENGMIPFILLPLTVSLCSRPWGWFSPKQAVIIHQEILQLREKIQLAALGRNWLHFDMMSVLTDFAALEEHFLEDGVHVDFRLHRMIAQGFKNSALKDFINA